MHCNGLRALESRTNYNLLTATEGVGITTQTNVDCQKLGGLPMNGQLLLQGFELLLLGMGIVFGFLILLVFMLRAMSGLAARFETETSAPPVPPAMESTADDGPLIAVISIAVARYRASHRT